MGGTLDNGIYLPDQGERNCYNGLKNNWDTLDNLIETVQALSSAGLTREIVNSLPTENIKTNVIYMLRNSQQSGDLYDEYMYINNAWEPIGTSATEMDNYYTKSETNALPAVASGITASKVTGYDSHVANTEVHITAAERSTWNGKQNALDTDQTAAVNSGVNATKVTEYDTHVADTVVHVTASDKTAWNAKQDGLSQAQLNAVNSGVTSAKVTGYDTHVGDTSAHVSSSDRTAWNGKQDALSQTQLNNIAAVPDKANSADLATVATTGDYGDLLNAPTIPTVNNAILTIQKNGTDVATFTANASSNVTANLSIPVNTSDLNNDAGFLTQHNPVDDELSATSENALQNKVVNTELNGKAPLVHTHAASDVTSGTFNIARIPNLDASKITSGTIDIARLPKGSLERLIKVANQAARYALTTDDVQLGDTVQQLDTGVMYVVTDETKLDSADGYTEFTAGSATSVPWAGVTGKPSTFTPSSHTHGNITNDGKVGTTANLPLITGTGGAIQAGSFGNQANTFCEGNDSRLSDARTPVAHTHTKSDVTNLFNSANTWSGEQTFSQTIHGNADTASEFASNQSVTLTGTIEGTASSKAGWTIATNFREGRGGRTTTDFYAKLASGSVSGAWNVYVISFICNASERFETALVQVCLFVNQQGIVDTTNGVQLRIRSIHGLPKSRFVLVYKNDTNRVLFELYAYSPSANTGILAQLLNEFIRNNNKQSVSIQTHSEIIVNALPDGYTVINAETALTANDFIPLSNNSYDLGSSSYQWNNLYAKNYYYNGVAWGLDKINVWSGNNQFTKNSALSDITSYTDTSVSFTGNSNTIFFNTRGSTNYPSYGTFLFASYSTGAAPDRFGQFKLVRSTDKKGETNDGYKPDSSFNLWRVAPQYLVMDMMEAVRVTNDGNENSLKPITTGVTDLGTSTNKWKSLNGVNPGALSLPKTDTSVTAINTSGFSFDGSNERIPDTVNLFSDGAALVNGWLCARLKEGAGHYVFLNSDDETNKTGIIASCFSSGIVSALVFGLSVYVPVKVGDKPSIRWVKPNGGNAQLVFYPCFGNV